MSRLPFNVTKNSLTFYVKGRPYHLHKDHQNYAAARALLLAPGADHDPDQLIELVDVRKGLERASFGAIQFDGNDILWRGKPLTGLWVERILAHRTAGEAFDHLWKALDKLVHNPTATAIERLPIFLDRVGLGFLPDGRFLAFKGVQADYHSAHANKDGTRFRHFVGDAPRMAREEVDPDPNQTCSTGLHVGAPGYVRGHYSGGSFALVLVAVDPVDVVSVPTDYHGEKMRVCGYEVIEHLDQDYSDEMFGRLRNMTAVQPKAPEPAPAPARVTGADLAALACVGDVVHYAGHDSDGHTGYFEGGEYEVIEVDEDDDGRRLRVATSTEATWIYDEHVTKLVRDGIDIQPVDGVEDEAEEDDEDDASDYDQLKVGDVIEYEDGQGVITYGRVVTEAAAGTAEVLDIGGDIIEIDDDMFTRLVPEDEITASMVVTKGTLVRIKDHDFLADGDYTIAGFEEEDSDDDQVEGNSIFWAVLANGRRLPIRNRNIVVANHEGEHLWPRTKVKVEGDTVTLTSLDGHDLRRDVNLADLVVGSTEITDEMVREVQVENVEVGQKVEVAPGAFPPAGIYPVVAVYHGRVQVQTEFDGIVFVNHDQIVRVVTDA